MQTKIAKGVFKQNFAVLTNVIKVLLAIDKLDGKTVPMRALSSRLFSDSKYFEHQEHNSCWL